MTELARRRRALMAQKKGGLPSEYQEVEYIGTDDTASNVVIATDISLQNIYPAIFEFKAYPTSAGMYGGKFFQIIQQNGSGSPPLVVSLKNNANRIDNGNDTVLTISQTVINKIVVATATVESNSFNLNLSIDGTDYSESAQATPVSWEDSGLILKVGYQSSNARMRGKYYYLKITQQGTVTVNLIPCYRKADSAIGMYDLVSSSFFEASGTWYKGADV